MKRDTLMVLSGGMDSVTMLHEYKDSIDLAVTLQLRVKPQRPRD